MSNKEPNWYPGIQKQAPFHRGVEPDNPRHLKARKPKERAKDDQQRLPMETRYLDPILCEDCRGLGRVKKGKICRECKGKGVVPAEGRSP